MHRHHIHKQLAVGKERKGKTRVEVN